MVFGGIVGRELGGRGRDKGGDGGGVEGMLGGGGGGELANPHPPAMAYVLRV